MGGKISISGNCCSWIVSGKDQANDLYDVYKPTYGLYDMVQPVKSLGMVLNKFKLKHTSRMTHTV